MAAVLVMMASLSLPLLSGFVPVAISQGIAQTAAVIFPPAIAAVSLGIFGHAAFMRRIGRNETFNHAGNAVAAALAGVTACWFGPTVLFYLLAAMAVASLVSIVAILAHAIDHDLARGLNDSDRDSEHEQPSGIMVLLTCRPCSSSRSARCYFISPTPPCCRWSDKSSRFRTRISAPA